MDDFYLPGGQTWDFPGWGTSSRIASLPEVKWEPPRHRRLGVIPATAICGNDITSSCLYVSALAAAQAGAWAPVALGIVAAVLYLFRKVYAEVGGALPLNGGTYTVLLNTTNKRVAAAAACLTLLSYVATAVISAGEAMAYLHHLVPALPVVLATAVVLGIFAFLNIMGITESAVVATIIFTFHIFTLTVLSLACGWSILSDPTLLAANWGEPPPGGLGRAIFFGFSAAMLGISGFESSANFIEEQKPGVFPRTLRNMWIAVAIFNPLLSFLSLGMLPLDEIRQVPPDLLAQMGVRSWGAWLGAMVSIDAVAVLSGAVLTSYVGVTGLMRRMALDRCLPQVLLRTNRWRGTNHFVVLSFMAVALSILAVTEGDVEELAGVYTMSFLSVMALFAVGNMLLKTRRARLPRPVRASWPSVLLAFLAVSLGLLGNVIMHPDYVATFATYFAATAAVVALMFLRVQILTAGLVASEAVVQRIQEINDRIQESLQRRLKEIFQQERAVYFAKGDDPAELNRAALYVLENEQSNHLIVVHFYEKSEDIPPQLAEHLREIDHLYPNLRIDFLAVKGTFGPESIEALSRHLGVPKNFMFMGTPSEHFQHRVEQLGGVRIIL